MRLDQSLFRSKLSQRMFIMFIACALTPILLLAIVAYVHYPEQFRTRAIERLRQYAKSEGMMIYERLMLIESEMQRMQISLTSDASAPFDGSQSAKLKNSDNKFKWLAIYWQEHFMPLNEGASGSRLWLQSLIPPDLSSSGPSLHVMHDPDHSMPVIYMIRPIKSGGMHGSYLIGVIDEDFLWGNTHDSWLPTTLDFCIWDQNGLMRSAPDMAVKTQRILFNEWKAADQQNTFEGPTYYAGRWEIFLRPRFQCPSWTVAVLESKSNVLAPVTLFNRYFLLIVCGVLVLLLLSTSLMLRKNLVPIEQLMDGVHKISQNRFNHRIHVHSGDEFEKLAQAFNRMSAQLEKQFHRLTLRSELDRTILSLLNTEKIIMAVLDRLNLFFPNWSAAITMMAETADGCGKTFTAAVGDRDPVIESCQFRQIDMRQFMDYIAGWLTVEADSKQFEFLRPLQSDEVEQFIIFPIWVQKRIFALMSFGVCNGSGDDVDDLHQARQLANQLAIAFSKAELISELRDLNMGTLHALARTVDAKSPWTAGHSMRVMRTCLDIGRAMGLPEEDLDDLHRASLLHDIGKIGVPASILDKEEGLSPLEMEIIRTHSSAGVRILSPIKAYEQLLPIIHQHHERFDGNGYPLGLCGDQIHKSARILALADTYDALVSDRPYRRGMHHEQAVELIGRLGGSQLDPEVVAAFVQMVKGKTTRLAADESIGTYCSG